MSTSLRHSFLLERILRPNRCFGPMLVAILVSVVVTTLSFQLPKTVRRSYGNANYRILQMGSPFVSSFHGIPPQTILCLSGNAMPFDSNHTQQEKLLLRNEVKKRDMEIFLEWSRNCGIVLADGMKVTEDLLGDWSLTATKSLEQGESILTVPSEVILTSDVNGDSYLPYYSETEMQNVYSWMESELESGPQSKQDYLPEYMLVYKLIREVYLDRNSRWHAWLQSLPTQFSTGLYLDALERKHVERMASDYLRVQGLQYQACLGLFQKLTSPEGPNGNDTFMSPEFLQWMMALDQNNKPEGTHFSDLIKWAFTVVFTRSWRSPDRKQAQIVPFGDLANHDSQFANIKPSFLRKDGAMQFFVTDDIDVVGSTSPKLYLSYGLTYSSARYLVLFGFCDVTAAYIDARLDFLQDNDDCKWPTTFEPSHLVVSTENGALSEEVWIAFLYKSLEENDPDLFYRIRETFGENKQRGEHLVEKVLEERELSIGMDIQAYYQRLLETDFMPISVEEKDLAEHPNLSMIVNYNLFMRETYFQVLEHVSTVLTQLLEFEKLSTSKVESELNTVTPQSQSTLLKEPNKTVSVSSSEFVSPKSKTNSIQSTPTQIISSEPEFKLSKEIESDISFKESKRNTTSEEVQDIKLPNPTWNSSSTDQRVFPSVEAQEIADFNTIPESNGIVKDQMPYSQDKVPQTMANPDKTSMFSYENFSLQSYSKVTSKSYDDNSDPNFFPLSQSMQNEDGQTATSDIPTGNFNPEFYSKGRSQENLNLNATSTFPRNKIKSQPSADETQKFAFGDPEWQFYSHDQDGQTTAAEEGIDPVVNEDTEPRFDYDQTIPVAEVKNTAEISGFPNANMYPKFYSGKTIPGQESFDSTKSSGFPYREIEMSTAERIDSSKSSDIPDENGGSRHNSMDLPGSPQDEIDFMTSYAQSLVLDQRGHSSAQQKSDEANKFLNQNNPDISPTPSTYAEYIQQRQEESDLTLDPDHVFTSDPDARFVLDPDPGFALDPDPGDSQTLKSSSLDDSEVRINDDNSIKYDGEVYD